MLSIGVKQKMCICTVVELMMNLLPVKVQAYKPLIPIQTQIN